MDKWWTVSCTWTWEWNCHRENQGRRGKNEDRKTWRTGICCVGSFLEPKSRGVLWCFVCGWLEPDNLFLQFIWQTSEQRKELGIWSLLCLVLFKRWILDGWWFQQSLYPLHKRWSKTWYCWRTEVLGVVLCRNVALNGHRTDKSSLKFYLKMKTETKMQRKGDQYELWSIRIGIICSY